MQLENNFPSGRFVEHFLAGPKEIPQGSFEYDTTAASATSRLLFCNVCGLVYLRRKVLDKDLKPVLYWTAVPGKCFLHGGAYWILPHDDIEHLPIEILTHDLYNFFQQELDEWMRTTSRLNMGLIKKDELNPLALPLNPPNPAPTSPTSPGPSSTPVLPRDGKNFPTERG